MSTRSRPRSVVMLAFRNCQILDVVGPLQILAGANDEREAASPAYSLTLLAEKKGVLRTSGGLALVADGPYAALPADIDTLMIAGGGAVEDALEDPRILAAIRKGAKRARRIVSICSGAFLLAATGLLKNRRATTHWRSVGLLKERHPDIAVERDALYVRDGRVWTSAGVTAGMDLALALLREDLGDEVALSVARRHVLFLMRPGGQSQFSAHLESEAFQKGRLAPLLRWIPEHVGDALDVSALAERANMSERSFARIFARETGDTPARYVERARLDAARRLLTGTDLPQSVVAERSGFGSEERMRRAFHRQLKVSPAAFRARFQPEGELR